MKEYNFDDYLGFTIAGIGLLVVLIFLIKLFSVDVVKGFVFLSGVVILPAVITLFLCKRSK